jgi:hypothetical protein
MTRKDYVLIAQALRDSAGWWPSSGGSSAAMRVVLADLADALACDNPRFDRRRFIDAATPAGRQAA